MNTIFLQGRSPGGDALYIGFKLHDAAATQRAFPEPVQKHILRVLEADALYRSDAINAAALAAMALIGVAFTRQALVGLCLVLVGSTAMFAMSAGWKWVARKAAFEVCMAHANEQMRRAGFGPDSGVFRATTCVSKNPIARVLIEFQDRGTGAGSVELRGSDAEAWASYVATLEESHVASGGDRPCVEWHAVNLLPPVAS